MIAQAKIIKDKILDVKYGRVKEGLGIDIPEIDEYLRFKKGNFNLLIGHANVGKTTIIIYLFVVWAIEWCDNHFKIIDVEDLYTYKQLLKESESIKEAWNYDALLVDPYNSLAKDYNLLKVVGGHEYDYQVASEFRMFAKQNNVSLYLNAHGVTEALRRTHPANHEYSNLSKPLSMGDVEGGGKWGNRADDVMCVHRYTNHSTDWLYSLLYVLKVKENETGGRPTPYEEPIRLKMKVNNTGFLHMERDILNDEQKTNLIF